MTERRIVTYSSLDQGILDAESLLTGGYTLTGKWDLAQCCAHLNDWLSFPMDGFPKSPLPIRLVLGLLKVTIGKRQLKKILDDGFKPGIPTQPDTVYRRDAKTDAETVETLKATVERFEKFDGAIYPSPFFGQMDKPVAERLQLRHFEHHLGFLLPK